MAATDTSQAIDCKCRTCRASEDAGGALELSYRYRPGRGHAVFHLLLHGSLPLLGALLIGRSWWALVPLCSALAAYLFNSLYLCPSCPYHHDGVAVCGCYPKSIFPLRRYPWHPWGARENGIGRTMVVALTLAPPAAVLAVRGETGPVSMLLAAAVTVIFLTSVVSCPRCRQRSVCALGRLSIAGIRRKDI